MTKQFTLLTFLLLLSFSSHATEEPEITLFAAASLTNALSEIAETFQTEKSFNIKKSFASSAVLAKQIENGAPADIFISADHQWMNYLKDRNALKNGSMTNLLGNQLVLIAPKGKGFKVDMQPAFNLDQVLSGKLCTGEMRSVPVGIYARQALTALGWIQAIKQKIVGTQDVRSALTLVERGECAAGIVYETDAKISGKVETIGIFPDNTHEPVVYPVALTKNADAQSAEFYDYLKSAKAKEIFTKYGFTVLINLN